MALIFLAASAATFTWVNKQSEPPSSTNLYLIAPGQTYLNLEPVDLQGTKPVERAKALIEALIRRSDTSEADRRVVPLGTKLLGVTAEGDTVTLNFNSVMNTPGFWSGSEHEYLAVYAIVNTVTQVPGIQSVQIRIEGQEVESLGGHVELGEPLGKDEAVMRTGKAGGRR
ncbi:MAG: GerMN domain-containing protein [Armatimonadetes bacterium]|nr:GerMN domain-containing protein [Armatimonadota bacterium]